MAISVDEVVFKALAEESKTDFPASEMSRDNEYEEIGLDSLSIITAIIFIEDGLDIEIRNTELSRLINVRSLCELCEKKVKEKNE